jgi:glutamate formiminotransferase/formiminotetrahydrofolate cyclodeaminase
VGSTFAETQAHVQARHDYDLEAFLRTHQLDPKTLEGQKVYRPGKFKHCKAIGWYVADYRRAQISINLTNYRETPVHTVFDAACRLAAERGLRVTGSEIVGLVPFQALLDSGRHYLAQQGKPPGAPMLDVLRTAVTSLGLSDVAPFDLEKKVLGLPRAPPKALIGLTVRDFTDEVSRDTPAPGGGSISALAGSLGAALTAMVANLTHGKEGTEARDEDVGRIASAAQWLKDELLRAVDDDTNAFRAFMAARSLPQATPEEKALRREKMQAGLRSAAEVPLHTAELSHEVLQLARAASEVGNPNSLTDAAVGAQLAFAGVRGAVWNVLINLKDLDDAACVEELQQRCAVLLSKARAETDEVAAAVDAKLQEMLRKRASQAPTR